MKKWMLFVALALFFFLASIYLFIPGKIPLSKTITVQASKRGLHRSLFDQAAWEGWWPGKITGDKNQFIYGNFKYEIKDQKIESLVIDINNSDIYSHTLLSILPAAKDSLQLSWQGEMVSSNNPFIRLSAFSDFNTLEKNIDSVLQKMKTFFSSSRNIYGYDIKHATVKDSILVSTYGIFKNYPSTEDIYNLIGKLKTYIKNESAEETGLPMLNIITPDSTGNYIAKVAVPVNKRLPSFGNITYKWMLAGGNILVTEVKGGKSEIDKAFAQIENYISDRGYVAPAIPFLSLVTDRMKEPDSSKWITRIYYPIMYF